MNADDTGLLLLSGGRSRRMGARKHALDHPGGGSWGGHLVGVFEAVFPGGPVLVLGEPLPDRPELTVLSDPREGPAAALRAWALAPPAAPGRWWVAACDQVRWTPARLEAWATRATAADPHLAHWVMALSAGHLQTLGSWLPDGLRPHLAQTSCRSLAGLVQALPHLVLPSEGPEWRDVDTPEERTEFELGG